MQLLKYPSKVSIRLPITPETLRLRILGRGKTQQQAIAEVRSLERTDPQRSQILQILAN